MTQFSNPLAEQIWDMKYRLKDLDGNPIDKTVEDTWRRVAKALAAPEKDRELWEREFYNVLSDFSFIPAGRIIAGAGTDRNVTLFNCFSGDTPILTKEFGSVLIEDVAGQKVHVMDGNGDWVLSPINSFGKRGLSRVYLEGGYNKRQKYEISATDDHRWILEDGSEKVTKDLKAGDTLLWVNMKPVPYSSDYKAGVQHGIVFGDGTKGYKDTYTVRLCGDKKELAGWLEDWRVTFPPSSSGDPHFFGSNGREMKEFPNPVVETVDYLKGFFRGWLATDGSVCQRDQKALISCGSKEAEWLEKFGPVVGFEVAYSSELPGETNYGVRNIPMFNCSLNNYLLTKEDFLRSEHRENFKERTMVWSVKSVVEDYEEDNVYCPRVTTTDSVQLLSGVHSGQCYVMGTIPDDMSGIFEMLKEAALTMQAGGGIGYDFSTLRPKGAPVKGVAADASGPLTFMDVWDAMCRTIMSAGTRRGAMMATMRCDHPDIFRFIDAKRDPNRLRMFNVSVLVTDEFMEAVEANRDFDLKFDDKVYRTVSARGLWDHIMQATYGYAEPGVIFIDRINKANNLWYIEDIAATNPCGEQPLPPYGACLLGSINLTKVIEGGTINYSHLGHLVRTAIRMMDNVNDVSKFPLEAQMLEAKAKRRIGLGVTGLADALAMMGVTYGSDEAVEVTENIMQHIAEYAYAASCSLAKEKGAFPALDVEKFLQSENMKNMSKYVHDLVRMYGIRNALLTSIAPTGTISLYAGNVSSGIEPIFALEYDRKVLDKDGNHFVETVKDYAVAEWKKDNPGKKLPEYFVTAQTLAPVDHVKMQAAAQKWVDSSISKTINCPEDISFDDFKDVYLTAWRMGCKGCTTYRPNEVTGSVLEAKEETKIEEEGGACELKYDPDTGQLIRSCE